MTFRTESRMTIASSVHEVWAYLCDVGRWPEWARRSRRPGSWRRPASARLAGGAAGEADARAPHRRSQEVTVVEPPRSMAFAGTMGTSAARWGMELSRRWADRRHDVDRGRPRGHHARGPRGHARRAGFSASAISRWRRSKLRSSPLRGEARGPRWTGARFCRDATEIEEHTVSQTDRTRERLIETYRKKAKHYDITSRLYPAPGYPQRTQRLRAVQALGLRRVTP